MRSRLEKVTAFGLTIRPPLPSAVNVARLRSISSASRTSSGTSLTLSEGPMASTDLKNLTGIGHHEPDAFDIGRNLLKKLQPFSADRTVPVGESCEVAIGTRFVVNITGADRIPHAYENNRCGADFRPNNGGHEVGVGDQHVRCEARQLHKGWSAPCQRSPQGSVHRCGDCALRPNPVSGVPAETPLPVSGYPISTPTRRIRSGCCARAASG